MAGDSRPGGRSTRPVRGRPAKRSGLPTVAWIALGGLVLVLAGLLLTRQSRFGTETAAPGGSLVAGKAKLAVDREIIDFGRVPLDKPVTASFKLTNLGDKPLTLADTPTVQAVKGCWPPKAVVGSTTIQPGASTDLSMQFMMHAGMEGPHDFLVQVKSNDPDQPVKDLHVLSDWKK